MSFNINEFKSQLVGGGARPTLFQVQILNPVLPNADFKVPFMVKTAQLPGSTLGTIEVPYFGRNVRYAGDRTFEDWTVTVINDEDFAILMIAISVHFRRITSLMESLHNLVKMELLSVLTYLRECTHSRSMLSSWVGTR